VTLRGKADATREMHDLARRVRELAAAAGEDPADWLEDAARCREACEEIAKDVTEEREAGEQGVVTRGINSTVCVWRACQFERTPATGEP